MHEWRLIRKFGSGWEVDVSRFGSEVGRDVMGELAPSVPHEYMIDFQRKTSKTYSMPKSHCFPFATLKQSSSSSRTF